MVKLSILIPTLPHRSHHLDNLLRTLNAQRTFEIEIVIDKRLVSEATTGKKRNDLLQKSTGKYTVFVDDDDELPPYYVQEILKCIEKDPDVICFDGYMTTDGFNRIDWEIRLGHPYIAVQKDGKEFYLRFPNHLSPMKREHSTSVEFPDITQGEDYQWANKINELGLLKKQEVIEKWMYHYKYITNK